MSSAGDGLTAVEAEVQGLVRAGHTRIEATMLTIEAALAHAHRATTVVLVEGLSDQIAVEVLAHRLHRSLASEGTFVAPAGGATNLGKLLATFGPAGRDVRVMGLYDAPMERRIRGNLLAAGIGSGHPSVALATLGFHACHRDLEEELIRTLGPDAVERVIAEQGELGSLRRLQQMPAQRDRAEADQLHRFIGCRTGRKYRYARALTEALDLDRLPPPLAALAAQL